MNGTVKSVGCYGSEKFNLVLPSVVTFHKSVHNHQPAQIEADNGLDDMTRTSVVIGQAAPRENLKARLIASEAT